MPTISQAARNSGIVFIGRIFNLFVDFIISIYLVRYLGSNDFGIYSFIFIYISFFGFVSLSGMDKVLVRALSKNENASERIIGNALTIRSILPMLGIFLSIIILIFLDYPPYTKFLIYITSITLFLSSLKIVYQSIFQTFLKMEYSVFSDVIARIFYLLFVAIIIFFEGNIFHLIIGIIISNFITLFANIIYSRKLVKPIFKFELNCIKKILIPSFPLTLAGFFFVIYHRIDVFMISLMKDFTAVGYYSAAFKLIETLNLIPVTLMISFFPLMIRQFKGNKNNFLELHEHGFKLMLIIGIPLAILTSLFSKEIVLLVFGSEFMPSSDALLVLIWAEVFVFLNFVYFDTFISMGRQTTVTIVTAAIALVNILLNFFLIPKYSFVGASIATLFSQALGSCIFFYYIYVLFPTNSYKNILVKMFCVSLIFLIFLLAFNFISTYISAILSLLFYTIMILTLKILPEEEISGIKSYIKKFFSYNSKI